MSTFKVGDRIRVVTCSDPATIGQLATVLEDSVSGKHTRRGIPVETTYLRFDNAVFCQEGFMTHNMEMPSDQLQLIKDPS